MGGFPSPRTKELDDFGPFFDAPGLFRPPRDAHAASAAFLTALASVEASTGGVVDAGPKKLRKVSMKL